MPAKPIAARPITSAPRPNSTRIAVPEASAISFFFSGPLRLFCLHGVTAGTPLPSPVWQTI